MGIWDIFTGDPAKEAAGQQRDYFNSVQTRGRSDIAGGYDTAQNAITGGAQGSLAALRTGYGDASNAVGSGFAGASNALYGGRDAAMGYLDDARGAFGDLSALGKKYGAGTDLYIDSLGVNGAEGNAGNRGIPALNGLWLQSGPRP